MPPELDSPKPVRELKPLARHLSRLLLLPVRPYSLALRPSADQRMETGRLIRYLLSTLQGPGTLVSYDPINKAEKRKRSGARMGGCSNRDDTDRFHAPPASHAFSRYYGSPLSGFPVLLAGLEASNTISKVDTHQNFSKSYYRVSTLSCVLSDLQRHSPIRHD